MSFSRISLGLNVCNYPHWWRIGCSSTCLILTVELTGRQMGITACLWFRLVISTCTFHITLLTYLHLYLAFPWLVGHYRSTESSIGSVYKGSNLLCSGSMTIVDGPGSGSLDLYTGLRIRILLFSSVALEMPSKHNVLLSVFAFFSL